MTMITNSYITTYYITMTILLIYNNDVYNMMYNYDVWP